MTSSNKVIIENSITCIVCEEIFDDPRLMPCSHTYCRKCIEGMAAVNKDQFKCPLRDGCSIQRSNLCTNCHLVVAEYACYVCTNERFCSKCYQIVHAPSVMQKHKQLSIGEKLPEVIPCKTHPKKQLECWCYTCETVVCIDCLLFEHKDHKYALLDHVAKELEAKVNIRLQAVQSSLEYRINQAKKLINAIDNDSEISRKQITKTMTSLRETIDEHEKVMLEQILKTEKEQKKQLENYKTPLKTDLQTLNIQKATYQLLFSSKNHTKLLQIKEGFDEYMRKINGILKSLPLPARTEYCLEGLDQLQTLKEKLIQCGRYVEVPLYRNPQLDKLIGNNQIKREFHLGGKNLTDSDVKIVADVLRKNTTLTKLKLENNQIGPQGAEHIGEALKINHTLTILDLENNQIGPQGAQHIAEALKFSQTLTEFYFANNQIGQQGAQHIAEVLKFNQTLIKLKLENNQIGPQGAEHIGAALKINHTLTKLGLANNQIGPQGAQNIAKALKINQTLTELYLTNNQIGQHGARHIAEALKINQTLTVLTLQNNQIGQQGAQHISGALKINHTLTILSLRNNQIGQQGAEHIAEALKINQTLTTLYFANNLIEEAEIERAKKSLTTNTRLTVHW